MKVSKAQLAMNRAALVSAAAVLFQEYGFDGVGLRDISRQVGLTQGAVFGQFRTKSALAVEACRKAHADALEKWWPRNDHGPGAVSVYLDQYLQAAHVEDPGHGCPVATHISEIPHQSPDIAGAYVASFAETAQLMQQALSEWMSGAEARRKALVLIAAMAGSVAMARAIAAMDPALSRELIDAARMELTAFAKANST